MEPKKYPKEDIVINMQELLLHIALRWRSIVAGVLAIALLAVGFKYYKDYTYYQSRLQDAEQGSIAAEQLSKEELANVHVALGYSRAYQTQADYVANSPLMQIDPNRTLSANFSGVVIGKNAVAAANLYGQMLANDALCAKVADTLKWKQDSYVWEMINIAVQTDENANTDEGVLVKVQVFGPTMDSCRIIAEALTARWPTLQAAATQAAGTHTLEVSSISYETAVSIYFRDTQQMHVNTLNNLRGSYNTEIGKLTTAEKARLDELSADENDPTDDEAAVTPPSVSKKFLVLGFGGGLVLFVGLYALTYIFGSRVKTAEDLFQRFELPVLGSLPACGCKKGRCAIDRWLINLFRKEERGLTAEAKKDLFLRQTVLTAQKSGVKTVYVTGSALSAGALECLAARAEDFAAKGIALKVGPCPLQDAASMEAMADADALLLAETAGRSAYTAVARELAMAEQLNVPLLGAVILEK